LSKELEILLTEGCQLAAAMHPQYLLDEEGTVQRALLHFHSEVSPSDFLDVLGALGHGLALLQLAQRFHEEAAHLDHQHCELT
jgi:hypothetical protein